MDEKELFKYNCEKLKKTALGKMFKFINSNIEIMDDADFLSFVHDYASFICVLNFKYQFLDFGIKFVEYIGDMLDKPSEEVFKERKRFFVELQNHLLLKIKTIKKITETPEKIFEMTGQRRISIDPTTGGFVDAFFIVAGNDKLEYEKCLVDVIFADLIMELDLEPLRFRSCTKCGNYFYQFFRKKDFCSQRCGGAVRQRRYVQKNK